MKATARRTLLLSVALLLLLSTVLGLASCGGGKKQLKELGSYTLVYPTEVSTEVYREFLALKADLEAAAGKELPFEDDFVMYGEEVPTDTLEILVGPTNRKESKSQNLGEKDNGIYFENGRLVISGGSDAEVIEAIKRFREEYIQGKKVTYPKEPDLVRSTYPYGSATIDGVSIHQFTIVHDSKSEAFAKIVADEIKRATGAVLPIESAHLDPGEHEILVGRFTSEGRENTDGLAADKWRVSLSGGRLSLVGGNDDGTYSAVLAFLSRIGAGGESLELSAAASGNTSDTRLFALNLPDTFPDMTGKVSSLAFSTTTVLERFMAAREELPTEITVLSRVETSRYPLSERRTVYVSPNGSDTAAGTKEEPLATLTAALSKMKNQRGGVIFMMGGTYTVTETVKIDRTHSGLAQAPLFIKAYNGEEVTITSNKHLDASASKWHTLDASVDPMLTLVLDRIKESARESILYTSLAEQGWTEADIPTITKAGGPPSMFVGGEEYVLARYPNDTTDPRELAYFVYVYDSGRCTVRDGSDLYWSWIDRCSANGWDPMKEVGWEIRVLDNKHYDRDQPGYENKEFGEEITSWVNTGDIWYYGSTFEGWEFGYYNLALFTEGQYWAHVKNEDGTVELYNGSYGTPYLGTPKDATVIGGKTVQEGFSLKSVQPNSWGTKTSGNGQAGRNTFYLFNAIEALDAPGEWFYDKETGYLFLYPAEEDLNAAGTAPKNASVSNSDAFDLLTASGVENLVIDGLTFDGSAASGLYMESTKNAVIESCVFRNNKGYNLYLNNTVNVATIYSDFSAAGINMMRINNGTSNLKLQPTNTVVQNCFFHDPLPLRQVALQWEACRVIVSHNYFNCTTTVGDNSVECIFEYNRFEGGSKDVTDGGMIYASGAASRNNHYRYNLFHMFNATHQAVYNDTAAGGNYMYNNVISTLGAKSDHCKSWYSSTGWGNVCYGNIQIFRDPMEVKAAGSGAGAEGDLPELAMGDTGDSMGESHLFYYYFGDEHAATDARSYKPVDYSGNPQKSFKGVDGSTTRGVLDTQPTLQQSLAGHWWQGFKRGDVSRYLERASATAWENRDPVFMNTMQVASLVTEHYPANGASPCDYHIKYFYMPWYLSGKSYTYENVPAGTVITIPTYQYLAPIAGSTTGVELVTVESHTFTHEGGPLTLTYEEIASIEKQMRSCAYSIVKNNVILGGTPIIERDANNNAIMTEIANPDAILWDQGLKNLGYTPTTLKENNFIYFRFEDITPGAREDYDYTIPESGWNIILSTPIADSIADDAIDELRFTAEVWERTGFTYSFDYSEWYDDIYP